MDKLLIIDDEGGRRTVELDGTRVSIGRLASNTVQLVGENVSRRHARLTRAAGDDAPWSLEDLASYNGVALNDAPLEAPTRLAHGDRFAIGDHTLVLVASGRPEPTIRTNPRRSDYDDGDEDDTGDDFQFPRRQLASAPPDAFDEPTDADTGALPAFRMQGTPDELLAAAARAAVPPEVRELRLVFLEPADAPAPITLDRLPLVLGRGEGADVRIEDASVADPHARLAVRDGRLWIEPLDPAAGVEVAGEPVPAEGRALGAGDAIRLGDATARLARRHRFAPLPTPTRESEAPLRPRRPARPFARPGDARARRPIVLLALALALIGAALLALLRARPPAPPARPPRVTVVAAAPDVVAAAPPDAAHEPLAAEPSPAQRVAAARQALAELDLETALAQLSPLDARDDLPVDLAREASLLETETLVASDEPERAAQACVRAVHLGFDPDHAPDQAPRVRAACRAAPGRDGGAVNPPAISQPVPALPVPRAPAPSRAPASPTSPASRP